MIVAPAPESLRQLFVAAHECDERLDLALLRVGVYAPLDLTELRHLLQANGAVATAEPTHFGPHRIVVTADGRTLGTILHDGEVVWSLATSA